jgi:hypothetical protein
LSQQWIRLKEHAKGDEKSTEWEQAVAFFAGAPLGSRDIDSAESPLDLGKDFAPVKRREKTR